MLDFQADLRSRLLADIDLAAAIGQRFSWLIAEANEARPYIVGTTIADDPVAQSVDGAGRLHAIDVQFDCVGDSYSQARSTRGLLLDALTTVPGYQTSDWRFDRVHLTDRGRDDHDPPQNSDERGLFRSIVEATVFAVDLAGLPAPP